MSNWVYVLDGSTVSLFTREKGKKKTYVKNRNWNRPSGIERLLTKYTFISPLNLNCFILWFLTNSSSSFAGIEKYLCYLSLNLIRYLTDLTSKLRGNIYRNSLKYIFYLLSKNLMNEYFFTHGNRRGITSIIPPVSTWIGQNTIFISPSVWLWTIPLEIFHGKSRRGVYPSSFKFFIRPTNPYLSIWWLERDSLQ